MLLRPTNGVRFEVLIIEPPAAHSRRDGYLFLRRTFLLVGLDPDLLDDGSRPSLNGSPRNMLTRLVWKPNSKPTFENFSPLPLRNLAGENLQTFEDRHQSEARNFETDQQIDEQIKSFSSRINGLQNGIQFGAIVPN